MRIVVLWYFEQYPLKNVLHLFGFGWERKPRIIGMHYYTHTHTHTYDRWGPGGVFQAEESAGPPGDKAEGNDEDSTEELRFFFGLFVHAQNAECTCNTAQHSLF